MSWNQPRLCPNSTWNQSGFAIGTEVDVGRNPYGLFVTTNNTVYIAARYARRLMIWHETHFNPIQILRSNLDFLAGVFITDDGVLYTSVYNEGMVYNLPPEQLDNDPRASFNGLCLFIFIDFTQSFYCSMGGLHQVRKRSLLVDATNDSVIVAGTGERGARLDQLNYPHGIFVDDKFNLYVADTANDRIQLFRRGSRYGVTLVGDSTPTKLNEPKGITFDFDGNMFITDSDNSRIVEWNTERFRCIIGCSQGFTRLGEIFTAAFDNIGNLIVSDEVNHRILRFLVNEQSCSMYKGEDVLISSHIESSTRLPTSKAQVFLSRSLFIEKSTNV